VKSRPARAGAATKNRRKIRQRFLNRRGVRPLAVEHAHIRRARALEYPGQLACLGHKSLARLGETHTVTRFFEQLQTKLLFQLAGSEK